MQPIKSNRIRTAVLIMLIAATLTACMTKMSVRKEFEESIDKYNNMLSSQNFDTAGHFAAEAIAKEFAARVKVAKNIKIFDYRILKTNYDEKNGKAEAEVEINYYSLSSFKVNTIRDIQEWAYVTEKGIKHWRLMSLLPEFP